MISDVILHFWQCRHLNGLINNCSHNILLVIYLQVAGTSAARLTLAEGREAPAAMHRVYIAGPSLLEYILDTAHMVSSKMVFSDKRVTCMSGKLSSMLDCLLDTAQAVGGERVPGCLMAHCVLLVQVIHSQSQHTSPYTSRAPRCCSTCRTPCTRGEG